MVVGIVDDIEELSRLREEGSDLSVVPPRDDALAIRHEGAAVAFKSRYFNSEKLLSGGCIPHSDVIL